MGYTDLGPYSLDKSKMIAAFEAAAEGYEKAAVLQRTVAERLLERLAFVKAQPGVILDVGAGTGVAARRLAKRYRRARVIQLDIAWNMIRLSRRRSPRFFSRQHFVRGDAESLPFGTDTVDMIYANLTLQWCNDLDRVFREMGRVLRPDGYFTFTTFGPDTLKELRASWRTVDEGVHVNAFIDMHDIGDALIRAGLAGPVLDVEYFTLTYLDVYALMRDLKTLGSHNVTSGRRQSLTGRGRLKQLIEAYEGYRQDARLPATYEVIYGHAWGQTGEQPQEATRRVATVPLAALKGRGVGLPGRR